jgi:nucleoside-diphosphate-sugar epimerase
MSTRVLVTGAGGFVGIPLIARLSSEGHEVHAVGRRPPEPVPGVTAHALDLRDPDAVTALLERLRPERLVHLAWIVEHGTFWGSPENLDWVARSLLLLRAFAEAGGRRAVLVGTCAEYDWTRADQPLSESATPLQPATLYGAAKDALRRVAQAYAEEAGIELAWARLFFLYGQREDRRRLVAAVARALLAGESVQTSAGRQQRDFMHVDDVAGALAAIADSGITGAVNVGTGEAVAVGTVLDMLAEATGRPQLIDRGALPERPGEPSLLVADVRRLLEDVGFIPALGLQEGIESCVRGWREQPVGTRQPGDEKPLPRDRL